MKITDIRSKDEKELHKLLAQERNELRELRFKVASKQIKNFKEIGNRKNNIARIKTILNEKRLSGNGVGLESANKVNE